MWHFSCLLDAPGPFSIMPKVELRKRTEEIHPMHLNEILEAALKLSASEHMLLVTRLLETLPANELGLSLDRPDLLEELERRFKDLDASVPFPMLWNRQ